MTAAIVACGLLGIEVATDGDELRIKAPVGMVSEGLRSQLKAEKLAIIRTLQAGISLAELRGEATERDWPALVADPDLLATFAHAVMTSRMRERGEVPPDYTGITRCRGCGNVPIFVGCPPIVDGCAWCFNRHQGLPMPQRS